MAQASTVRAHTIASRSPGVLAGGTAGVCPRVTVQLARRAAAREAGVEGAGVSDTRRG